MTTILDTRVSQGAQSDVQSRPVTFRDKLLPATTAIGLALVLLYGAAFAATPALHNAAHDGRHSAGFPCH